MIFQTQIIWSNRIHSLKYLRSATSGSKDIVIRKWEFVAKTQFLCQISKKSLCYKKRCEGQNKKKWRISFKSKTNTIAPKYSWVNLLFSFTISSYFCYYFIIFYWWFRVSFVFSSLAVDGFIFEYWFIWFRDKYIIKYLIDFFCNLEKYQKLLSNQKQCQN